MCENEQRKRMTIKLIIQLLSMIVSQMMMMMISLCQYYDDATPAKFNLQLIFFLQDWDYAIMQINNNLHHDFLAFLSTIACPLLHLAKQVSSFDVVMQLLSLTIFLIWSFKLCGCCRRHKGVIKWTLSFIKCSNFQVNFSLNFSHYVQR